LSNEKIQSMAAEEEDRRQAAIKKNFLPVARQLLAPPMRLVLGQTVD